MEITLSISSRRHTFTQDEQGTWITNRDLEADQTRDVLDSFRKETVGDRTITPTLRARALLWGLNNGIISTPGDVKRLNKELAQDKNPCRDSNPTALPNATLRMWLAKNNVDSFGALRGLSYLLPTVRGELHDYEWIKQGFNTGDWCRNPDMYTAAFDTCASVIPKISKKQHLVTVLVVVQMWWELLNLQSEHTQRRVLPAFLRVLDAYRPGTDSRPLITEDLRRCERGSLVVTVENESSNEDCFDTPINYYTYLIYRSYIQSEYSSYRLRRIGAQELLEFTDKSRPSYWHITAAVAECANVRTYYYRDMIGNLKSLRNQTELWDEDMDIEATNSINSLIESITPNTKIIQQIREHAESLA